MNAGHCEAKWKQAFIRVFEALKLEDVGVVVLAPQHCPDFLNKMVMVNPEQFNLMFSPQIGSCARPKKVDEICGRLRNLHELEVDKFDLNIPTTYIPR